MKKRHLVSFIAMLFAANVIAQVQVDKFTGDVSYGLPLITVPNFRGPSVSTSISYRSDIKVDQPASEVGLGWNINAGGSIERIVNGVPDDWKDVEVPDLQAADYEKHLGALYFNSSHTSKILDYDYSRYKMDTLNDTLTYYYPNYDTYFVTGAGMAGKIMPENYDYATVKVGETDVSRFFYNTYNHPSLGQMTDSVSLALRQTETYTMDVTYRYNYKTHFVYQHNLYDTVESNSFPWSSSPINNNSVIEIPKDSTSPTYIGNGYNNENYSVTTNRNRTRTGNYIEYFTNAEIHAGVAGFMEYDTSFARNTEADFPQDGIGGYRITDPNGYTYHYSLPVYAHYTTTGSASLDQDFGVTLARGGIMEITDSTNGYIVENEETHEILEIKQTKKYAIRWLLTAITGPDYNDSNADGMVGGDDEGYWVAYHYGLWTESFAERGPYYGSKYFYSSSIDDPIGSKFKGETDNGKLTGHTVSYLETANQLYYLNSIETPSHTGIFCRDLRFDEQSLPYKHSPDGSSTIINNAVDSAYYTDHIKEARLTSDYQGTTYTHTLLIKPSGHNTTYDVIDVEFILHNCNLANEFAITVYDGETTAGTVLLSRQNDDGLGDYPGAEGGIYNFSATSGKLLVKFTMDTAYYDSGKSTWTNTTYDINWNTRWDNALTGWPDGRQQTIPQLKLSKLLLFDNNDVDSLPALSNIDTLLNDKLWNYTDVNRSNCYHSDWYTAHQSKIDSLALQSVDLIHDYSLARKYHNNRFVYIDTLSETATQVQVEAHKYIATNSLDSSGKLTLNKVVYYGLHHEQTQPAHLFGYNASDTLDNPYYNPLQQDYWGNFKSDAEGNLLRGYVSESSADNVDAWSLRTVTSPLGGTTEIVYESDAYEQVLSTENGGALTGPIKIYALKNVKAVADGSGNMGADWTIELANQSSEFWTTLDSLPAGTDTLTVIPAAWVEPQDSGYKYSSYLYADPIYSATVSYGTGSFNESTSKISGLTGYYDANLRDTTPIFNSFWLDSAYDSLNYAGGGYVEFHYPVGEEVRGGGTRVKELKVSDGTNTYTVNYNYNEGTATMEAHDFSTHKTKTGDLGNDYYWPLVTQDFNPFGLSPQVGYGKVTIENKGQATAGEGTSIFNFYVSDEGKNYFHVNSAIVDTAILTSNSGCAPMGGGPCYTNERRYAVELVDDFSSLWGKIKTQSLTDVNGTMVSKKVYEYETATKGAHVTATSYNISDAQLARYEYLIGIKRTYPNYLKKVTTYSNGRSSVAEIIDRDPFTGDPIETKNTSVNGTVNTEQTTLAYTQSATPNYSTMGAKSVNPDYYNFLNATYSSKTLKASENLSTSDFASYGKGFWKDSVRTRYYNTTNNQYEFSTDSVAYFDYTKYAWTGDLGNYGLFDNTAFADINTPPSGTSDWRFLSEITLMDTEQNVLEQKGYNDRFSASKLGYNNRFTYTSASNANYVSFTATGFETETEVEAGVIYYEGEVKAQTGNTQLSVDGTVYPHTGNHMVKIPAANSSGPIYKVNYDAAEDLHSLQRGRTYTASVWVHKSSPATTKLNITVEGDTSAVTYSVSDTMSIANANAIQIGDWIQLAVNIAVPDNFTGTTPGDGLEVYVDKSTSADAWVDDLLFHSRVSGSGMNVYDQRTGRVMATLSDNNFATKYTYNNAGQVIEVWKEVIGDTWAKWVKVESRDFNFKREMED